MNILGRRFDVARAFTHCCFNT